MLSVQVQWNYGGPAAPNAWKVLEPAGLETLADAISYLNANGGGQITFASSLSGETIDLDVPLPAISTGITIANAGARPVTISGEGKSTIFDVTGASSGLTLDDLTLTDGYTKANSSGGAITADAPVTLVAVSISGSRSMASPATYYGAGGGAIFDGASVSILGGTLSGNAAPNAGGGAISVYGNSSLDVEESTISGNTAGAGGAIATEGGQSPTVKVGYSTIDGNTGTVGAGGLELPGGTATVEDSTLYQNSGAHYGGAIYVGQNPLTVADSTIVGNSTGSGSAAGAGARYEGAGIESNGSSGNQVKLYDSIVAGNQAPTSPDIYITADALDAQFSLIGNDTGIDFSPSDANNLVNVSPDLGKLADNGGETETMQPLPGSPAIGAGKSFLGLYDDQRKLQRTAPANNTPSDIGAVEAQAPVITGISPASAVAGSTVRISTTDATGVTVVLFGGTPAESLTVISGTELTATVPAGTGTVDVQLQNPFGKSLAETGDRFSYAKPKPTVASSTRTFDNQSLALSGSWSGTCATSVPVTFSSKAIHGSKARKLHFKSVTFEVGSSAKHRYSKNPAHATISLHGISAGEQTLKASVTYTYSAHGHTHTASNPLIVRVVSC